MTRADPVRSSFSRSGGHLSGRPVLGRMGRTVACDPDLIRSLATGDRDDTDLDGASLDLTRLARGPRGLTPLLQSIPSRV